MPALSSFKQKILSDWIESQTWISNISEGSHWAGRVSRWPTAWREDGLSTVVTPTAGVCVGGKLEGGELSRPFFFFIATGLNGISGEFPPAVSMPSQTIQQRKTVVTVNPLKATSISACLET